MRKSRLVMVSVLNSEDEKASNYFKQIGFNRPLLLDVIREGDIQRSSISHELVMGYLAYIKDPERCAVGGKVYAFEPALDNINISTCLAREDILYFEGKIFDIKGGYSKETLHLFCDELTLLDKLKPVISKLRSLIGDNGFVGDLNDVFSTQYLMTNSDLS